MTAVTGGDAAPIVLFAPGAGAPSSSAWMRSWRDRLASLDTGVGSVETFDYPYRLAGRKAPDKLPVLVAAHRQALAGLRARHPTARAVVLVGKSMGGRVGCHVAVAEPEHVTAVICLGYPLRGSGGTLRDEVLLAMRTPVLFVQGTRDPLCPLDVLGGVRERMSAPNELMVVEGGNHSLEVPRKGRAVRAAVRDAVDGPIAPAPDPQETSDRLVLQAIHGFLARASGTVGGSIEAK